MVHSSRRKANSTGDCPRRESLCVDGGGKAWKVRLSKPLGVQNITCELKMLGMELQDLCLPCCILALLWSDHSFFCHNSSTLKISTLFYILKARNLVFSLQEFTVKRLWAFKVWKFLMTIGAFNVGPNILYSHIILYYIILPLDYMEKR